MSRLHYSVRFLPDLDFGTIPVLVVGEKPADIRGEKVEVVQFSAATDLSDREALYMKLVKESAQRLLDMWAAASPTAKTKFFPRVQILSHGDPACAAEREQLALIIIVAA